MIQISRTTQYALQAVLHLAQHDDQCLACRELATNCDMPRRFLLQVLRSLVQQGVLISARGAAGGYQLSRRPSQISLLDIIEGVHGPIDCRLDRAAQLPPAATATIDAALRRVAVAVRRELGSVSLAHLVGALNAAGYHDAATSGNGAP